MKYAYWLIHNQLCARPGPNEYPWRPEVLAAEGIGAVLSVNNGDGVIPRDLARHGIKYKKVALPITTPPTHKEFRACQRKLPKAYKFVHSHITAGSAVLVHCRHGNDRTGLFLAYYLARAENMTPEQAIDYVRARRGASLRARGWLQFATALLNEIEPATQPPG